jgi:2-polyprenyl-3-methyl-5-hydroxy-6-metoxy-1,4-benzoquinol methylase
LSKLEKTEGIALDIGCGTGELTKKLASLFTKIIGIDMSQKMVEEARKRNHFSNIEFINVDAETYLKRTEQKYDLIISSATFHHLDYAAILERVKEKLTINGQLMILDLYKIETPYERFLSLIAMMCNPLTVFFKRGSFFITREEKEAWRRHSSYDRYATIKEINGITSSILGKTIIRRHLFWRYMLIYRKDDSPDDGFHSI